jgi:hypothetical protein
MLTVATLAPGMLGGSQVKESLPTTSTPRLIVCSTLQAWFTDHHPALAFLITPSFIDNVGGFS